ncbi:gamma-glutamyltranspeptidase [Naematelia encephala]|uniref:Glutathione hydrolase n=1 Tax=Naematelia encephala TaxID=71784 RepID=A0A1Y2BKW2_9TREE|nr:gamma-glutamyltranspeptidase [Naematelia encephala]
MKVPPVLSGAVTSEHTRASEIGTDILRQGGNAVDALIATTIAVNTLCPYHSDIGGGGFALLRLPDGRHESLDFRHVAPKAVTMEFYKTASTQRGGTAVAVPGQMRGLEELHKQHGKLSWKKLLEPSIKLAREGFEMHRDMFWYISMGFEPRGSTKIEGSWMANEPECSIFVQDGEILPVGGTVYRKGYANTLETIAEEGAGAFYEGPIAEALVKAVRNKGGLMTVQDLKDYKPQWNTPLSAKYRGNTLWAPPAPASGAIWLSAMGTLAHFEPTTSGSVLDLHRLTEVLRLAYGQRTQLGDPAFVPGLDERQRQWISAESVAERAKMVDDSKTFPPDYYKPPGVEIKEDHGTSNITVADSSGLVISVTTTVGLDFGSRVIVPGYGFCLNDSMDDFSVEGKPNATGYAPSPANYVVGGKKPLSSSCPYIIENDKGEVVLAGGAAGGSTIISANTQVARNVLDYGMSAAEALRANRLHNQILPNVSLLERSSTHQGITIDGFSEEQARGLQEKGHVIEWLPAIRNTTCAIKFFPGPQPDWEPAGEPRKHGSGGSVFHAGQ